MLEVVSTDHEANFIIVNYWKLRLVFCLRLRSAFKAYLPESHRHLLKTIDDRTEMALHSQHAWRGSTQLVIVADDLTGASDAAVPFSRYGMPASVSFATRNTIMPRPAVLAISTASRDVPVHSMEERLTQIFHSIDNADHVFKKIDSVFRGNTFTEIALATKLMPDAVVVIAPAFPELNRFCRDGIQQVHDPSAEVRVSVYDGLRKAGVECTIVPAYHNEARVEQALYSLIKAGERIFLFDSELSSDLDLIVKAAVKLERQLLWVGSGGLAQALAQSTSQEAQEAECGPAKGRVLFCIGSDHPATQRQVEYLKMHRSVARSLYSEESVIVSSVARDMTTASIRQLVSPAMNCLSCIFLTGGDTAELFCEAMDVDFIEICNQFAPGVPVGVLRGGPLTGKTVILKSGGFGETELLDHIAETYAVEERRTIGC